MLLINLMEVTKGDLLRGEPDGQVEVQFGFHLISILCSPCFIHFFRHLWLQLEITFSQDWMFPLGMTR